MSLTINAGNQQYLADLQKTQAQLQQAQAQLSSGFRLQQASDDPSAIADIYRLQSQIALNQQTQKNLTGTQTELSVADSSLQSAIQAVQSALSLASQGASSSTTADGRANLAQQVIGLQQAIVSLSQTQAGGRYIFSGDQDTGPAYQYDSSQPKGVTQLLSPSNTRVIQDVNGTSIAIARSAQDIFDARDTNGDPAAGNVFAALQSLVSGLQNNDQSAVAGATDLLKAASEHLNGQLAFYGQAQDRVTDATQLAQKFLTQEQSDLGQVQDTDVAASALKLTQAQTQQQAALAVEAKLQQAPNLFSLLA